MTADTSAPEPARTGPADRDLVFRMEPEYYIGTYFLVLLFFGLLVIAYLPLLFSYIVFGSVYGPLQRVTMYLSVTYFLILLIARFARNEMDKIRFIVSDRSITRASTFSTTTIPYSAISRCSIRAFPLIKGFVRITAANSRITLPSTIHRFDDLAEGLIERLTMNGRNDLCSTRDINALRRIACVAAFSQARSRAAFFPLVYATIITAAFNAFIAGLIWGANGISVVVWSGLSLFAPLLVYGLADFRLNRNVERQLLHDPSALPRLQLSEELLLSSLVIAGVYACAGFLFKKLLIG
jgi:hypothetical protein